MEAAVPYYGYYPPLPYDYYYYGRSLVDRVVEGLGNILHPPNPGSISLPKYTMGTSNDEDTWTDGHTDIPSYSFPFPHERKRREETGAHNAMTANQRIASWLEKLEKLDWRVLVSDPSFRDFLKKEVLRSVVPTYGQYDAIIDEAVEAAERLQKQSGGDLQKIAEEVVAEAEVRGLRQERAASLRHLYNVVTQRANGQVHDKGFYGEQGERESSRQYSHIPYNNYYYAPLSTIPMNDMVEIFSALNPGYSADTSSFNDRSSYNQPPKPSGYGQPHTSPKPPPVIERGFTTIVNSFGGLDIDWASVSDLSLIDPTVTRDGDGQSRRPRHMSPHAQQIKGRRFITAFDIWRDAYPLGSIFASPPEPEEDPPIQDHQSDLYGITTLTNYSYSFTSHHSPSTGLFNSPPSMRLNEEKKTKKISENIDQTLAMKNDAERTDSFANRSEVTVLVSAMDLESEGDSNWHRLQEMVEAEMKRKSLNTEEKTSKNTTDIHGEGSSQKRSKRWQDAGQGSFEHYESFILPGNKVLNNQVSLQRWCTGGFECQGAAVRAAFQIMRGHMLALAETRQDCVLRLLCDAAAQAAAEGAVGAMAATLASGLASQFPEVVGGVDMRALLTARNVGLRTTDCSRFQASGCHVAGFKPSRREH
ncbi:hypothetical protein E2C01_009657 [Portunus trituberculatus]|uniref:Uncharacterized protein n=1 Tax=Portunus trituberculatus TaxID=210409 RepID=A0A5B7D6C1_PORTR|nr:hypothetical protein [Portunus trituberculatus]